MLCGLSGGVDSAVAALLVHRAVGDQLTCVFVDNGLLRKDEGTQVVKTFGEHFHVPLVHVDAAERFRARLEGIDDPEEKRRRIGEEFIRVFEEEARRLGEVPFLVQGTLYSDVIESGGEAGVAARIKSHHNVGGLPDDMEMELVEPLRQLFKDEVRRVGRSSGCPRRWSGGTRFPARGLPSGSSARSRGSGWRRSARPTRSCSRRSAARASTASCGRLLRAAGDPLRGRARATSGRTATRSSIRAVTSEDAMTADWARLPHDLLETISGRIVNEIPGVNRVVYDISSKPPSTIEWE